MKKFYTTILAALCVVGASAAGLSLKQVAPVKQNSVKASVETVNNFLSINPKSGIKLVPLTAGEGIEGTYTVSCYDCYFEESTGDFDAQMTITESNGKLIWSSSAFPFDVEATYNESTGEITFDKKGHGGMQIGTATYYVQFVPTAYVLVGEKGNIVTDPYTVTFDKATRTIQFPADHGFGWGAYSSATYAETGFAGWIELFDVLSVAPLDVPEIDEEQEGQWETIGTATLEDAWITCAYRDQQTQTQFVPAEHLIHCDLQQNKARKTQFRLWRPYHDANWTLVNANTSLYNGQIVFSVADPDHVVIAAGIPAGFKNSNGDFYVMNLLGWQINNFGDEWDDSMLPTVYQYMAEKGQPFDTFKDGVVTINQCGFDVSPDCKNYYTWNNNTYTTSKITFPSNYDASSIYDIFDNADANAPVEYFNLQGMKIETPAAGQIVIRRQGSKVEKQFVK